MSNVRQLRPDSYSPEDGQLHTVLRDGHPVFVRSARFAEACRVFDEAVEELATDLMEQTGIGPWAALDEARRTIRTHRRGPRI